MATPINKVVLTQIIERNQKALIRQEQLLKATLDEIAMLEAVNQDGAYNMALENIKLRRNRQHALVKTTKLAIAGYKGILASSKT